MLFVSFRRFVLFAGLVFLFAGCAAPPAPRFVWPPPPEQPRMEWKGVFYSDYSLKVAEGKGSYDKFLGTTDQVTMASPFGIVSDGQGKVYVSDVHKRNVWVFNFNTQKVELLRKNSTMQTPLGLALDDQGRLYVADGGRGVVWVYGTDGKGQQMIGQDVIKKPAYLAIGSKSRRLFVSDGFEHKIHVFDLEGNWILSFGERGNLPGQFFSPQGLAIGPDGNLYVADMFNARVQFFDQQGKYLGNFGERGDQSGQFENPKDLAFDSEGNLHVIDGRRSDLMTFTPEGKLLLVTGEGRATTSEFGFSAPRSISVDANDTVYIAENLGRRFARWQYMSAAYLQTHPYTEADREVLFKYMENLKQK